MRLVPVRPLPARHNVRPRAVYAWQNARRRRLRPISRRGGMRREQDIELSSGAAPLAPLLTVRRISRRTTFPVRALGIAHALDITDESGNMKTAWHDSLRFGRPKHFARLLRHLGAVMRLPVLLIGAIDWTARPRPVRGVVHTWTSRPRL